MSKKKVTLSVEAKTYSDFKKYCDENAILLSKKVEIFMDNFMKHSKQKRNVYSFFALFFGIILMINFASADNLLLKSNSTIGVDTFIQSAFSSRNQGVTTNLEVKSATGDERALLYFNLSNLSSDVIVSNATLTLYRESGADNNPALVGVYRVNRSWTEGTGDGSTTNDGATWNSRNGSVNWDSSGGDFSSVVFDAINISGNGFYVFSLTNLIRGWVNGTWSNYGLILSYVNNGETRKVFTSSDGSNSTNWPALNITYLSSCTPNLTNTSWTAWANVSCSGDQMNQTRNRTQYDANNCGASNLTIYDYQLVGPNWINSSWTNWFNISICQAGDYYTQQRNKTQTDSYGCAAAINYYEYQNQTCDYCTPSLINTSWSNWYNAGTCQINDTIQQARNRTQYDQNYCGEVSNQTFIEYQSAACDYCSYGVTNTTWSSWQNETGCLANNTQQQNRSKTEYDANYGTCYLVTGLASDLWNSGNNNTYWEKQSAACSGVCGDAVCQSDESCSLCSADCGSCSSSGGGSSRAKKTIVNNTNSTGEKKFEFGIPEISIDSLSSIVANPGESRKLSINIKNSGTAFLNKCKLGGNGEFASWISSDETKDLSIGQMAEFLASLNIPKDAKPGSYKPGFSIACSEITKNSNIEVELIEKKLVLELSGAKKDGDGNLAVTYSLAELAGEEQAVKVELVLLDSKGNRVAEKTEENKVGAHSRESFESVLTFSDSVSEGNLNLLINANSEIASAFVQEYVVFDSSPISGFALSSGEGEGSWMSMLLVLAFFVFAFFIVKRIARFRGINQRKSIISILRDAIMPKSRA